MRGALKQALFRTLEVTGLNALSRWSNRESLVVLNYHGVMPGDLAARDQNVYCNTVGTEEFAGHLEFLTRHFNIVKAADVEAWIAGQRDLPERAALLTFDDGRRNNLTYAAPILQRYNAPAILFLATSHIGANRLLWTEEIYEILLRWPEGRDFPIPNSTPVRLGANRKAAGREVVAKGKQLPSTTIESWLAELRAVVTLPPEIANDDVYAFLTWDEVRQLPTYGFELGSHTVSHWITTRCAPDALRWELETSKAEIEKQLNKPCLSFCYPNGTAADWSNEVAAAVKSAGYRVAYTLPDRIQPRTPLNPYAIERLCVPGSVPQQAFRARVSGTISLLRRN